MEETPFLILLSVVMLVGSYLAGSIPLVMTMSEVRINQAILNYLSVIGEVATVNLFVARMLDARMLLCVLFNLVRSLRR